MIIPGVVVSGLQKKVGVGIESINKTCGHPFVVSLVSLEDAGAGYVLE
jgi:hypothetical protein